MRNFLENGETQTFYYAIKRRPTVFDSSINLCREIPVPTFLAEHHAQVIGTSEASGAPPGVAEAREATCIC